MTVFVFSSGATRQVDAIDPSWLRPDATEIFWIDFPDTSESSRKILKETFRFHDLAIEDAIAESHHPKVEPYDGILYVILHGIVAGKKHDIVVLGHNVAQVQAQLEAYGLPGAVQH